MSVNPVTRGENNSSELLLRPSIHNIYYAFMRLLSNVVSSFTAVQAKVQAEDAAQSEAIVAGNIAAGNEAAKSVNANEINANASAKPVTKAVSNSGVSVASSSTAADAISVGSKD